LPDGLSGIFFSKGLDRLWVICPSGCYVAVRVGRFRLRARRSRTVGRDEAQSAICIRKRRITLALIRPTSSVADMAAGDLRLHGHDGRGLHAGDHANSAK
jgi:hypothetical protein